MDEKMVMALAQAILAGDEKAKQQYAQLSKEQQNQVVAAIQQLQQQQGGQQQGGQEISDEQLQQLAQAILANDPKAIEIAKKLPPEVQKRLVAIAQQMQGGEEQGEAPEAAGMEQQEAQGGPQQGMQPQMMKCGGKRMVKKSRVKMKKGGKWIQKAINPKHKGYCTPITKSTCTPRRKALALRFKKGGDLHK